MVEKRFSLWSPYYPGEPFLTETRLNVKGPKKYSTQGKRRTKGPITGFNGADMLKKPRLN
jgi:hypothetical protein